MTDDLAEYIRRYRDDYTREAINQQLLSAGYTSVEIAAAWREVDGIHFSDPPRDIYREAIDGRRAQRFANSPRFWSILVGFLLLSYLVPGLLIYASFTSPNIGWLLTFGLVFFFALQIFALVFGLVNMDRDRPTSMGLLISVLSSIVLVPCIGVAALYGICTGAFRA